MFENRPTRKRNEMNSITHSNTSKWKNLILIFPVEPSPMYPVHWFIAEITWIFSFFLVFVGFRLDLLLDQLSYQLTDWPFRENIRYRFWFIEMFSFFCVRNPVYQPDCYSQNGHHGNSLSISNQIVIQEHGNWNWN